MYINMEIKSKHILMSGFRRLFLYILGTTCFLLHPCHSTLKVYLNKVSVNLTTSTKIDGFSFQFQTCAPGVLLRSLDRDFKIEIVPGNRTKHSHIKLTWNNLGTLQTVELAQYYSVDANVVMKLDLSLSTDSAVFSMTNMDVLPNQVFSITTNKLKGLELTNSFQIGSSSFDGCLDSGRNINIDAHASTCPLQPLVKCQTTVCPDGFNGRYCETNIDECAKSECYSFSTCIDLINDFRCICGKQWTGRLCDQYLGDLCASNPCQNDGLCKLIDGKNNYTCTCRTNYVGDNCETFVDPCSSSPCKNGGTCSLAKNATVPNKYTCACPKGFNGIHCELKEDPCGSYPCNQGKCILGQNGTFTCNCSNTGLYGDRCENNINECLSNPCANNATCIDKWGSYDCKCLAGFRGSSCGEDINECSPNPCLNGANCTDGINSYSCKCVSGYSGTQCEKDIDECATNKCVKSNTEKCVDRINAYECSCKAGYSGQFCETDINDCNPDPCQNGARCVDLVASYQCICQTGYDGRNCSNNIDDCVNKCNGRGTCTDGINQYTCFCNAGYTGKDCETNVDDCTPNPCQNFGTCKDGVNDYTCSCIPSYIGKSCTTYRDPCNPTNPCFYNNTCLDDAMKGYKCNCTSAYDGDQCQHKYGPCYPNPCTNGATCTEENNSFKCSCKPGYEGKTCSVNINECEPNPCKNGGTCHDGIAGFTCTCPIDRLVIGNCADLIYMCPQYWASTGEEYCLNGGTCNELGRLQKNCTCKPGFAGTRCENDIDECTYGYCRNNVSCIDKVNDYECKCKPGYTNKNCTENIDECAAKPCLNGGVCTDKINDFSCQCKNGYEGKRCEIDIDWCTRLNACQNGAQCKDGVETYTCNCQPGFTGRNCSTDVNECLVNPCVYQTTSGVRHESTCVEKSNLAVMKSYNLTVNETSYSNRDGYVCVCKAGLSGVNCSTNINDCTSTTCKNGATCVDLINDFKCNCKPGYRNKQCSENIDECLPNPCKYGSTCKDGINDYSCACVNNTKGKDCSTVMTNCSQHNPCQNKASNCTFTGSSYLCECASGYGGQFCTEVTNINFGGNGYWQLTQREITDAMAGASGVSLIFSFSTTLPNVWLLHMQFVGGATFDAYIEQNVISFSAKGTTHVLKTFKSYSSGILHDLMITTNKDGLEVTKRPNFEMIKLGQAGFENIQTVYFGGVPAMLQSTRSNYTGCMRDFKVGAKVLIPKNTYSDAVVGACGRKEVCFKDSCNGHGKCIDEWTSHKCECDRQYYGDKCQFEVKPFSFGFVAEEAKKNTTTKKRRSVSSNYAYSDISGNFDDSSSFSFLMRTRQANAFIALLIQPVSSTTQPHLLVYLKEGKINVRSLISGLDAESPQAVNDGKWQEIVISPKGISSNGKMHAMGAAFTSFSVSRIYIGGVDPAVYNNKAYYTDINFDGCFQAVKLKSQMLTNEIVPNQPTTSLSLNGVKTHIGSCPDNKPCKSTPCLYGGTCTNAWYDYECNCTQGFTGKTCSAYGCQNVNQCQVKADCVNIPGKIGETICSKPLTFNGQDSHASLKVGNITTGYLSFDLQTRRASSFILGCYDSDNPLNVRNYFVVALNDSGILSVRANYLGNVISLPGPALTDGVRHSVVLQNNGTNTVLTIDGTKVTIPKDILNNDWKSLLTNNKLDLGLEKTRNLSPKEYYGAMTVKQIGETVPKDSDYTLTKVEAAWKSDNPCKNSSICVNGNCVDIFNAHRCDCYAFYTGDRCDETIDVSCAFHANLCNNGTCTNLTSSTAVSKTFSQQGKDYFKCNCSAGYEGYRCEKSIDECKQHKCKNGATCIDKHLSYACQCVTGWTGQYCETDFDDCAAKPCGANGDCTDKFNDFECKCYDGRYQGKRCDVDVNECLLTNPAPCSSKGACANLIGDYNCNCTSGNYGKDCQYNSTQYCAQASPCRNGATCTPKGLNYECTCTKGYTGTHCDQDFQECAMLKPCQNNATCNDSHGSSSSFFPGYNCLCTAPYEGVNCTVEKDPCSVQPCKNGGTCTKVSYNDFKCACTSQYTGSTCSAAPLSSGSDDYIVIIIAVVVVVVVLIIAILLLLCYFKKNSGQQGTYKPNAEEAQAGAVPMDTIKKPKVERLI